VIAGFLLRNARHGGNVQILHSSQITSIPAWAHQLATLTRLAWSDQHGRCWFPYLPLTTQAEWLTHVAHDWASGAMHSWVAVVDGQIVSHVALLNKGTYWEMGRMVAMNAPHGATHELCRQCIAWCRKHNIHARMECTQAHTRTQQHALMVDMRFAGIGTLDEIDGVRWDIIFFDTLEGVPSFKPRPGVLADPLGIEIACADSDLPRLWEISHLLRTDRGGVLPPTHFHILPVLADSVRRIITLNSLAA
jgi:hypothetical protein